MKRTILQVERIKEKGDRESSTVLKRFDEVRLPCYFSGKVEMMFARNRLKFALILLVFPLIAFQVFAQEEKAETKQGLTITWEKNYLTISGDFPGDEIRVHYLEAYCRPNSTDRDWRETVIPHRAKLVEASDDKKRIVIRDVLQDGVTVEHVITAGIDEVEFNLTATNPTDKQSQVHWAQPCIRVDKFTGCGNEDARDRVPAYARKCFMYIDGKQTYLPTQPWADKARYVYGQVYVPQGVNRNDVNPRPLSPLVPSNGLCGCESADDKQIFAVAWEPYQEIFQGVIACIHSDFRIGGLKPGETKKIRGKIYLVEKDHAALLKRFQKDFPEQSQVRD